MKRYQEINSKIVDKWCEEGWIWGKPISHEEYLLASKGKWEVLLTPTKYVPKNWFPDLKGLKVLGLASGGGQQMPVFSALGARCTVLDYSKKQLESEKIVSEREKYEIDIVRADMSKKLPFEDSTFDLIFHPVSNIFIKDVKSLFKECYRVLKKDGIFLAGLSNEINYIVDEDEKKIINKMPFDPTDDEALYQSLLDKGWGIEFSHSVEEQIGGQLEAGFVLTDILEDTNGYGYLHEKNIKTFMLTRSIKK